jgi:DNA-binding GntR family transcriptional regulator
MERACRDGDEESIVLTDIEFHRFLIERAGDPDLSAIWNTILVRIRGHFREETHRMRRRLDAIYRVHQQSLASFRSGDKRAAIKKLEAHIW